jgi:cardiolipin synthase
MNGTLRQALLLPNLFSLLRLALTPVVGYDIVSGGYGRALALFVVAAFTDIIDGYLARRFNLMTRVGAWLDPVTDKAMLCTIYFCLGLSGALPGWLVALVFGRDILILLMAGVALAFTRIRDFPPSRLGKYSTFSQIVTAVTAMVHAAGLLGDMAWMLRICIAAAATMTSLSGTHYLVSGIRRLRRGSGG